MADCLLFYLPFYLLFVIMFSSTELVLRLLFLCFAEISLSVSKAIVIYLLSVPWWKHFFLRAKDKSTKKGHPEAINRNYRAIITVEYAPESCILGLRHIAACVGNELLF